MWLITSNASSAVVGKLNNQSPFTIRAIFESESRGTYQLQLQSAENVSHIGLNGQEISFNQKVDCAACPFRLDKGWYDLRITGKISNNALPDFRFGKGSVAIQCLWYPEATK